MGSPHDRAGTEPAHAKHDGGQHTFSVTVPSFDRVADGAANAAMLPVAFARQVLPAKKGLPLYLGLGVLAAVDVLEWPVAIGIGIGYAVLRRDGGVIGAPPTPPAHKARETEASPSRYEATEGNEPRPTTPAEPTSTTPFENPETPDPPHGSMT
ncbi:hypothetical protein ACFVGY_18580 [Streptomyces sp. NPDC127106]|uniref:hypothetical protein n=1 Tax=Streptomyces sp. NPDC127106 TaxID=3345360 RepID=UPI00363508D2